MIRDIKEKAMIRKCAHLLQKGGVLVWGMRTFMSKECAHLLFMNAHTFLCNEWAHR